MENFDNYWISIAATRGRFDSYFCSDFVLQSGSDATADLWMGV